MLVVLSNAIQSAAAEPLLARLELVQRWLSHSTIKPFPKLALCHAFLAKLPLPVLVGVVLEGEPLLSALFPVVCNLFDGWVGGY